VSKQICLHVKNLLLFEDQIKEPIGSKTVKYLYLPKTFLLIFLLKNHDIRPCSIQYFSSVCTDYILEVSSVS
jgi:hypothetical protein